MPYVIHRPTVLVLGAGASKPYGFPTALELLAPVYASVHSDSALKTALGACGFKGDDIAAFCRRLRDSGQYSIDSFIEREPRYLDIGKAAIAFQLLHHEHNNCT